MMKKIFNFWGQFYQLNKLLVLVGLILYTVSCKKLAELPIPHDRILETNVFTNDETAIAALTGIYARMGTNSEVFTGSRGVSFLAGLSADEFSLFSVVSNSNFLGYYRNGLTVTPSVGSDFWSPTYLNIRKCNAAIEGLSISNSLTPRIKQQLLGEAKFLRAFFYFYLTNFFGDVPLLTSTDYKINSVASRSPKTQVYQQIITDLIDAKNLLSADYLDGMLMPYGSNKERIRPTRWAASALLARVYLYNGDLTGNVGNYANAEAEATILINNSSLYNLNLLSGVFLKNSSEAIWQLQSTTVGRNTEDALMFIIPSSGPSNAYPVQLSNQLLSSFEPGDKRRYTWIDSITIGANRYYFPSKYKVGTVNSSITTPNQLTEYLMVLRLGEQYLIRAEARAQQNNISGAQADLNIIRSRANLLPTIANNKNSLLVAIFHERQVEFFTEWGHRWLDLKRTGSVDAIMNIVTPLKGGLWNSNWALYPIPLSDIVTDPYLTQNPGYN